jgi:hypothetical protein
MTPPKFHVGQKVRLSIEVQALLRDLDPRPVEGTVLDIRLRDGRPLYQVGGQIGENSNDLWNMDFRENELAPV